MNANADCYEQIVEAVHHNDGSVHKVGFREGKWIAATHHGRVAVSKSGFLLYLEYNQNGQARYYKLYCNFAEMAADDVDFSLLDQVATAIDVEFIEFLD